VFCIKTQHVGSSIVIGRKAGEGASQLNELSSLRGKFGVLDRAAEHFYGRVGLSGTFETPPHGSKRMDDVLPPVQCERVESPDRFGVNPQSMVFRV